MYEQEIDELFVFVSMNYEHYVDPERDKNSND